jgi:hypothetical protein
MIARTPSILSLSHLSIAQGAICRGITVYTEYQSVCPFVGLGFPTPSPASKSFCGRGGGGTQFGRLDRKPGTLYTLWLYLSAQLDDVSL